eukprot:COSAG01_NODE_1934_length_8866_cov_17.762633_9_plen_169_part_00
MDCGSGADGGRGCWGAEGGAEGEERGERAVMTAATCILAAETSVSSRARSCRSATCSCRSSQKQPRHHGGVSQHRETCVKHGQRDQARKVICRADLLHQCLQPVAVSLTCVSSLLLAQQRCGRRRCCLVSSHFRLVKLRSTFTSKPSLVTVGAKEMMEALDHPPTPPT